MALEGGGVCGGGGVSAVLAGPPFLQREKRLGLEDLIFFKVADDCCSV